MTPHRPVAMAAAAGALLVLKPNATAGAAKDFDRCGLRRLLGADAT